MCSAKSVSLNRMYVGVFEYEKVRGRASNGSEIEREREANGKWCISLPALEEGKRPGNRSSNRGQVSCNARSERS